MTQSPDAYRLAIAQNVAANGRLFCVLLAAANFSIGWHWGVAYAAVPVACAWLADLGGLAGQTSISRVMSIASVVSAIVLAIATLLNCW
jgi:hypothetical protein